MGGGHSEVSALEALNGPVQPLNCVFVRMLDGDGADLLVANPIYRIDQKMLDKSH